VKDWSSHRAQSRVSIRQLPRSHSLTTLDDNRCRPAITAKNPSVLPGVSGNDLVVFTELAIRMLLPRTDGDSPFIDPLKSHSRGLRPDGRRDNSLKNRGKTRNGGRWLAVPVFAQRLAIRDSRFASLGFAIRRETPVLRARTLRVSLPGRGSAFRFCHPRGDAVCDPPIEGMAGTMDT
jgi:hypothetical protein